MEPLHTCAKCNWEQFCFQSFTNDSKIEIKMNMRWDMGMVASIANMNLDKYVIGVKKMYASEVSLNVILLKNSYLVGGVSCA